MRGANDNLHSRYAPEREAERYVRQTLGDKRPSVVFIVAGARNYIGAAVAELSPHSRRVLLQPCDDFLGCEIDAAHVSWSPGSVSRLSDVIDSVLEPGCIAGGVCVLEWPPLSARYPAETAAIREALKAALEAASADAATRAFWAPRWLRNCLRFSLAAPRGSRLLPGNAPIVIACAGPSLDEAAVAIARVRSNVALWSLASAVPVLLARGLRPDLVIATDPGFWNALHLRDATRLGLALAAPPSCYLPPETLRLAPLVTLDTGLSFERAAIGALSLGSERALASGSSAGTALSLALSATSGPVFLAAYDLAAKGYRDHAQRYAFDALDEAGSRRASPELALRAARILTGYESSAQGASWRVSRSFAAYAAGIAASGADTGRVYRLSPSPVDTRIARASLREFSSLIDRTLPVGTTLRLPRRVDGESARPGLDAHDEAPRTMLESLALEARELGLAAVAEGQALPSPSYLFLAALAPRETAALVARAARGEAELSEADLAFDIATERAGLLLAGSAAAQPFAKEPPC